VKYFDEMCSTYGFNDGDSEPIGLLAYRAVYLTVLNALLELAGATVRVIGFNRTGLHNRVMILPVTAAFCATLTAEHVTDGLSVVPDAALAQEDTGYTNAVCAARELDLDDYVVVQVAIDTAALEDLLSNHLPALEPATDSDPDVFLDSWHQGEADGHWSSPNGCHDQCPVCASAREEDTP
jgi:hypothetical protein